MPFYVGNARCPTCRGHGVYPCPMCVGYRLSMPPPDPVNGPQPVEDADVLVSTKRWLRAFPDSRMPPAEEGARHADPGSSTPGGETATGDDIGPPDEQQMQELYAEAAFNFYALTAVYKGRSRRKE